MKQIHHLPTSTYSTIATLGQIYGKEIKIKRPFEYIKQTFLQQ